MSHPKARTDLEGTTAQRHIEPRNNILDSCCDKVITQPHSTPRAGGHALQVGDLAATAADTNRCGYERKNEDATLEQNEGTEVTESPIPFRK